MRLALAIVALAATVSGCGDTRPAATPDSSPPPTAATATVTAGTSTSTTTAASPASTSATAASTTAVSTTPASTVTPPIASPTTPVAATPYMIPVADASGAGWGDTHSTYPATDIFNNGCGGTIVSPVNGVVLEARRVNAYDPAVDNPATRGGRSVSILGDDGVRYYLAHFELIDEAVEPGLRVEAGSSLGTIGTTGRSSACHVHFGISPPCAEREWSVRRGVVWPYRYLDDWRAGGQASPAAEVAAFVAEQPDACREAAADPTAVDA